MIESDHPPDQFVIPRNLPDPRFTPVGLRFKLPVMSEQTESLSPDLLLRAYAVGIFPMADSWEDPTWFWVDPERRGIFDLDRFHVPRSLRKVVRAAPFDVRIDTAFTRVMLACAKPGPGRTSTWITPAIVDAYTGLHRMGHAHSVECWQGADLVGGLYGVSLGAAFFGESMFSAKDNASKVALVHLAARLKAGGYELLDAQFRTDHLSQFGIVEVSRSAYRARLGRAISRPANFYFLGDTGGRSGADTVLQLVTHTS